MSSSGCITCYWFPVNYVPRQSLFWPGSFIAQLETENSPNTSVEIVFDRWNGTDENIVKDLPLTRYLLTVVTYFVNNHWRLLLRQCFFLCMHRALPEQYPLLLRSGTFLPHFVYLQSPHIVPILLVGKGLTFGASKFRLDLYTGKVGTSKHGIYAFPVPSARDERSLALKEKIKHSRTIVHSKVF